MSVYRSAMGKSIDMAALHSKNERVRAVSNVKNLNARGDTIDAQGRIVVPVTEKINNAYGKTVGNRSAQVTKKPPVKIQPDVPKISPEELTLEELQLEESFEDDLEIEKIKEEEIKKVTKKK
jgi:hypothetical protein